MRKLRNISNRYTKADANQLLTSWDVHVITTLSLKKHCVSMVYHRTEVSSCDRVGLKILMLPHVWEQLGLWQFMATTGKQYDLQIDSYIDERRDPESLPTLQRVC